jgi:glycosyltransferase involved in cell wall biosynthesis
LVIVIPFGLKKRLEMQRLPINVHVRQLPPFYKYINYALTRTSLPIPIELLYGRGTYIFPNYKTWYVPFSHALTFVHDVAFKIMPEVTHPKNLAYLEANFLRWLKRADTIIAISDQTTRDIECYFPEYIQKVKKVYLGVDTESYYIRSRTEIKSITKKYGIKDSYFLYVGNIEPRKNLSTLLETYKLYCDKYGHGVQLVLIGGDGWKNQDIISKIKYLVDSGYDVYRPASFVKDKDLPAIYSGCRALVHIALYEGYGLSLVQAQSCGAPIIASDLEVFRETLNHAGVVYVDAMEAAAIADQMARADELRAQVNNAARHTWANAAHELMEIINA